MVSLRTYPSAGDVVSDGFQQLLLTGREPVVVDSVEQLGVTSSLEVLGVLYAGARRKAGSIQIPQGSRRATRCSVPCSR